MEFQKGFTAYVNAFSLPQLHQAVASSRLQAGIYIINYRIDEYAEYLYREKEVELVHLPLEEVKEAIAEADFI